MFGRWLLTVFSLLLFPLTAIAQKDVRVVVLPFEVHAHESADSLKEQIPGLIEKQLTDEGVAVIRPLATSEAELEEAQGLGLTYFRGLGADVGADFVIWGSFTQIGKRYSLDATVLESYSETPPQSLYVEGEGIEDLLDSVRQLARDIGIRVLGREKVAQVVITGNKRIETEAVKRILKTKEGDIYSAKHIQGDVKSIYKMGYFGDVRVEATSTSEGKVVTFRVGEKETVRHIGVRGNKKFDDEKVKEIIGMRQGSILNINTLLGDMAGIKNLYKEEGYHNVRVTYEIKPVSENSSDIDFVIEEGKKILIETISFEGNKAYDDDTLKDLMKTKEKGFFSWITSSGDLDREVLEQDVSKIAAYYHNHGYIQARFGEPQLTYDKDRINISVKIEEGPQFKVGKVNIEGDLIWTEEALLEKIKIGKEQVYNREVIREDILALGDIYSDEGYAYADISPRIDQDLKEYLADITYVINKGPLVYFEKIIIAGNTKTRDKVIRRELNVYEQELFSGKRLKRGTRNLYRLNFFEDIKVSTSQGTADDKMVLKINVTEKPTGAFSFGGGYSSVDHVFVMASISQKNWLGRGQILGLRAQLGARTTNYTFSFTEPWLFDIPLTVGTDLYNTSKDYDTYDKDSLGGTLRCGYPVFDYTRIRLSYNYERADIRNLTDEASSAIREFEGVNVGHTVRAVLRRDSRDRIFNPTEGSDNSLSIEHAGTPFGGDIGFTKYVADSGWYIPLFWDTVGVLHGSVGFIHGDFIGKVPVWERFALGGMNSVRGYDWRDISPRDPVTGDEIGGNKMLQFNVEFLFPLISKAGLVGVLFYDTGNAYDNGENMDFGDLRKSVGYGVRWYSPMGPMRLEYGYILDSELRGEGGWEFTMGMAF